MRTTRDLRRTRAGVCWHMFSRVFFLTRKGLLTHIHKTKAGQLRTVARIGRRFG